MAPNNDSPPTEIAPSDETVNAVLDVVARSAHDIRNGLPGRRVAIDEENPSGESQKAADVYADELLCDRIGAIENVGEYASEERQSVVDVGSGLSVCVDPLDGSSNLEPNAAMGTIVAIYDEPVPASGSDLVAAAYVLYGATTTMLVALEADDEVTEYVIHPGGDYEVAKRDLTIPDEPSVYGFGGRVPHWVDEFRAFVDEIESDPGMKLRYGGAMIGDVNQVLTYGGIFGYPTLTTAPEGKLRVQFEAYPVGYIVESAGGASSDGQQSLLDVEKDDLHARTPVYVGNKGLIDDLETALADR